MKFKVLPILFLIAQVLFSCNNNDNKKKEVVESYPVTSPILIDTTLQTDYVAEIKAIQNVEIRSRVKGYLDKIYIDEGKSVKQGQLMFSIYNPELKEQILKASAAIRSALAELNGAEIDLANVKRLVQGNVVAATELEVAKNKVEMMKAKVEEAQANESFAKIHLSYTQIKAPFSGIVNLLPIKAGSLTEEGTFLTNISNNSQVFAYFDVSEKEYLNYMMNVENNSTNTKNVTLIMANGEEHQVKGKIETMEGEIDPGSGNIAFRARFDNPTLVLKHGASGKVKLLKWYKNAMVIPQKAAFEIQDKIYVYVINNKNQIKAKAINVKHRMQHFYIVDSGLKEEDRIVYEGIQDLKDGVTIKPQFIEMKDILKKLANKIPNK